MKSPYVNDLPVNDPFHAVFLVHSKEIRQKKSGDPYLSLTLADKTGDIDAKMWDNASEVMDTFERDDFVRMKGILQIFQNRPQLTIHKLQRVDEREVDFADFFPASVRNPDEMWTELLAIVASIGNQHLRSLVDAILAEPATAQAYKLAPAAKSIHHAFLSGLIEHVLSMCGLAKAVAAHYKDVDLDLLLAGVILHDIGKIQELTYARAFGYSDDGQLLGHIAIGLRLIGDHIRNVPDFPPKLRSLLEHMVLSHHGQLEFGSPKVPLFTEALLLHQLDSLDSKMDCMRTLCAKDKLVEGNWTSYSAALDRAVLKKLRYLGGQGAAAAAGQTGGTRVAPQHATIDDLESKFNFSRNR